MTHEGTGLQRRFESIKRHAEKTHKAMLDYAKEGQPIPHSSKLGEGFEIRGSISSYIRKASREATGHDCDKDRVTQVRNYLRYTHNVASIRQTEDKFVWLIFIRGEWNEYDAVLPLVFGLVKTERANKNWYERKVTPEEAGETRPVAPVKVEYQCKKCEKRFLTPSALGGHTVHAHKTDDESKEMTSVQSPRIPSKKTHERITKQQFAVLQALADSGGVIESVTGEVSPILAEKTGLERDTVSGVSKRLEDKGFITRDKGRAGARSKRTYAVHLTMAGLQVEGITKPDAEEEPKTLEEPVLKKPRATIAQEESFEAWLASDSELIAEIVARFHFRDEKIRELESAPKGDPDDRDKIDLVASLVKDFEDGKCSALKTISDIAEAVRL